MTKFDNVVAKIIADICIFLEFSGESTVNPDAAVEATEQIAAHLQELTHEERLALAGQFVALSQQYEGALAEFVVNLGDMLGLME